MLLVSHIKKMNLTVALTIYYWEWKKIHCTGGELDTQLNLAKLVFACVASVPA